MELPPLTAWAAVAAAVGVDTKQRKKTAGGLLLPVVAKSCLPQTKNAWATHLLWMMQTKECMSYFTLPC